LKFSFQRPAKKCRTFVSESVDATIETMKKKMTDPDLARLFENAFPNTVDTTIRWHVDEDDAAQLKKMRRAKDLADEAVWDGAQSFVVTGDINAEWLRDSTNQLGQYQKLAKKDKKLEQLILGAVNTQAEYVIGSPYCNAFQPPGPSGLNPTDNGQKDTVHPTYEPSFVFECKYELDSLANFLALGNTFYENTGNTKFLTERYYYALETVMHVLEAEAAPTFNKSGAYHKNEYTFQRDTTLGTETLSLEGIGNPLGPGTGLIRSAFRPSDDATIFGFFIPANAMMSVELKRTAAMLKKNKQTALAEKLENRGNRIAKGVWEHGTFEHPKYGKVFAYEVDGYGSRTVMDDANIPSLLALPLLGFVDKDDETYQNTRKMLLEKAGNPYFLTGDKFHGVGGPHVGLKNAWPMSLLVQAQTSDDDKEIMECVDLVKKSSRYGLVHESVNVNDLKTFTRKFRLPLLARTEF
jgi:uncharacterized protein